MKGQRVNRTPLDIFLLILCFGLGLGVWSGVTVTPSRVSITRPVMAERPAERVAIEPTSFAALAPIADRPLFSPSRRPPEIAPAPPVAALPLPRFALIGIIQSGETRRVLLRIGNEAPMLVGVGDDLSGWRIAEVAKDAVTVERAGRQVTVTIDDMVIIDGTIVNGAGAPPTAASAAPPAGRRLGRARNSAPARDPTALRYIRLEDED